MPVSADRLALNIATGTADFVLELIGRGGHAVGIDLCADARGQAEKLQGAGFEPRALLVVGEAERLPVRSPSTAPAWLRAGDVTDMDTTFAEMARAVRPGGQDRGAGDRQAARRSPAPSSFLLLPPLAVGGACLRGDSHAYRSLPNSLKTFKSREELSGDIRHAAFTGREGPRPFQRFSGGTHPGEGRCVMTFNLTRRRYSRILSRTRLWAFISGARTVARPTGVVPTTYGRRDGGARTIGRSAG